METPLYHAIKHNHLEAARLLLNNNADADIVDGLHMVACNDNTDMANLLIGYVSNVNEKYWHARAPIYYASINGHYSIVQLLLEHDADPMIYAYKKDIATIIAKGHGHYEIAQLLLSYIPILTSDG
jgi:ankyrin repeat protein